MIVARQKTYENDSFVLTVQIPTIKNCQNLVDYARPIISKIALGQTDDKAGALEYSIPSAEQLGGVYSALANHIVTFKAKDAKGKVVDDDIDVDNLTIDGAAFLHVVALQLYSDCFQQSEIKKK